MAFKRSAVRSRLSPPSQGELLSKIRFRKEMDFCFIGNFPRQIVMLHLEHPLQMPTNAARYFIWDRCPLFLQKRTVNTCFQERPMRTTDGQMEAYLFGHRHIRAGRIRSVPAYIL